jgi:hypothetical protein
MTNEQDRSDTGLIHVAPLSDLQQRKVVVVQGPDRPIAAATLQLQTTAEEQKQETLT